MKKLLPTLGVLAMACTSEPEVPAESIAASSNTIEDATGDSASEQAPLSHCEYIAMHTDAFAVQFNALAMADDEYTQPLGVNPVEGWSASEGTLPESLCIVHGPQGGAHLDFSNRSGLRFSRGWYDADAYQAHVNAQYPQGGAPDVSILAPSLSIYYRVEDATGAVMADGVQGFAPWIVDESTIEAGQFLMYLDQLYAGVYPDVTIQVQVREIACDVDLIPPTVWGGVMLRTP